MNKKLLAVILALAVVVAALVAVYFATRPEVAEGKKSFSVTIVYKSGETETLNIATTKTYVGECLLDKGVIQGEQGPYGLYVQEVAGERAVFEEDGAYWAFYVGEEYATLGIDQTPIENGQTYKLVYTVDKQ